MLPEEGDRIKLVHTSDEYTNLEPGDEGTVTGTQTIPPNISPKQKAHSSNKTETQVHVDWDNGSNLSLIKSQDEYEILAEDTDDENQTE